MHATYDIVDVHISSFKSQVDCILQDPLLDGDKKYTVEVTELVAPLSTEPPLLKNSEFASYPDELFIARVRRKVVGQQPGADTTLLSTTPVIGVQFGPQLIPEMFLPDTFKPVRTPQDLAYYLQRWFDDIKHVYVANPAGIVAAAHGGGVDVLLQEDDLFVKVTSTPNNTIRLFLGEHFVKHFWIETTPYGKALMGWEEVQIAFRTALVGSLALTNNTAVIVAGETGETIVLQSLYPLTRHFDHRERLELQTDMPIPSTVVWNTDNTQKISNVFGTFPIDMKTRSEIQLNTEGADSGEVTHFSELFSGDVVWRRAEDKVSERYEIMNSKFFQNIRLELFITRRVWLRDLRQFSFKRFSITLADGESWQAKLRFRTL